MAYSLRNPLIQVWYVLDSLTDILYGQFDEIESQGLAELHPWPNTSNEIRRIFCSNYA
jgi:hypothetical protein